MKHVIVIETVGPPDGKEIDSKLQAVLVRAIEIGVEEGHGVCFVDSRFNQRSAIAAVHEMYGAPQWKEGEL